MGSQLDDFSKEVLTELERQKLRKIIQDEEVMRKLWASGRIFATWISGAISAVWIGWDHVRQFFKWLVS